MLWIRGLHMSSQTLGPITQSRTCAGLDPCGQLHQGRLPFYFCITGLFNIMCSTREETLLWADSSWSWWKSCVSVLWLATFSNCKQNTNCISLNMQTITLQQPQQKMTIVIIVWKGRVLNAIWDATKLHNWWWFAFRGLLRWTEEWIGRAVSLSKRGKIVNLGEEDGLMCHCQA